MKKETRLTFHNIASGEILGDELVAFKKNYLVTAEEEYQKFKD